MLAASCFSHGGAAAGRSDDAAAAGLSGDDAGGGPGLVGPREAVLPEYWNEAATAAATAAARVCTLRRESVWYEPFREECWSRICSNC